jgi:hypothetical protein
MSDGSIVPVAIRPQSSILREYIFLEGRVRTSGASLKRRLAVKEAAWGGQNRGCQIRVSAGV